MSIEKREVVCCDHCGGDEELESHINFGKKPEDFVNGDRWAKDYEGNDIKYDHLCPSCVMDFEDEKKEEQGTVEIKKSRLKKKKAKK